jgi:hypothetical protein
MIIQLNNEPNNKQCKIKCDQCGYEFYRTYISVVRAKHHFCDIECRTEYEKDITHKPAWKTGEVEMLGYVFVKTIGHPYGNELGYVKRSRLVMEQYLGRYLEPDEIVHHINRERSDDSLENLMYFPSSAEHTKHHSKIRKHEKFEELCLSI